MSPLLPIPVTTTRPAQRYSNSMARSKSRAMGPAILSARARSASASMRTTFSATFLMTMKISTLRKSISLRQLRRHDTVGAEDQHALLVGAACQGDGLAVERNFHRAGIAGPNDNLVASVDGLHVRRADDAAHDELSIGLNRYPGAVFGTDSHFEWSSVGCD